MAQAAAIPAWIYYATAAVGVATSVYSGVQQKKVARLQQQAAEQEAQASEQEAKLIDVRTRQEAANRLDEMNANIAAIEAVRGARGLSGSSPTGISVIESFRNESIAAMSNEKLGGYIAANQRRKSAQSSRVSGAAARITGNANAALSFGEAFGTALGAASKSFGSTKSTGAKSTYGGVAAKLRGGS